MVAVRVLDSIANMANIMQGIYVKSIVCMYGMGIWICECMDM